MVAVLQKYATQEGCGITGATIKEHHNADKSVVKRFTEESKLNRGIVCSVEFPGEGTAKIELEYITPIQVEGQYKLLIQKQPGVAGHTYEIEAFGKKQKAFPLTTDKELIVKI